LCALAKALQVSTDVLLGVVPLDTADTSSPIGAAVGGTEHWRPE